MDEGDAKEAPPRGVKPSRGERKKLWLGSEGPLASDLLEAFTRILDYAIEQQRSCTQQPEKSIHEFRKSIRRARSLLKLMRGFLPDLAYRSMADGLRRAVRHTSNLRDVDVLVGHARDLQPQPGEEQVKQALTQHLARRQARQQGGEALDALDEGVGRIRPLPGRLGASLPLGLGRKDLRGALRTSYRRVRKSQRKAAATPEEEDLVHDLRKRVKELRYQLELLRPVSQDPEPLAKLAGLAEELGAVTDLYVLRNYVRSHRRELGPCHPERLIVRMGAEADRKTAETLALAAEVLALKPRAFVKAVLG